MFTSIDTKALSLPSIHHHWLDEEVLSVPLDAHDVGLLIFGVHVGVDSPIVAN